MSKKNVSQDFVAKAEAEINYFVTSWEMKCFHRNRKFILNKRNKVSVSQNATHFTLQSAESTIYYIYQ